MASISTVIPDPVKQFTDGKGKPYAAGKLFSYDAGPSLTLRPTYADANLTTPNTNPVVLDAAGRATIFLDQAVYRFVLLNALDQTQWDQDNVPGSIWLGMLDASSVRTPLPNTNSYGHRFDATINRASSGVHPLFTTLYVSAMSVIGGPATITEATTVFIAGAPSAATTNYALYVAGGLSRFDGTIRLGSGQVSLAAGATATLGKIGGAGPTSAAQSGWQKFETVTGASIFLPYWI